MGIFSCSDSKRITTLKWRCTFLKLFWQKTLCCGKLFQNVENFPCTICYTFQDYCGRKSNLDVINLFKAAHIQIHPDQSGSWKITYGVGIILIIIVVIILVIIAVMIVAIMIVAIIVVVIIMVIMSKNIGGLTIVCSFCHVCPPGAFWPDVGVVDGRREDLRPSSSI